MIFFRSSDTENSLTRWGEMFGCSLYLYTWRRPFNWSKILVWICFNKTYFIFPLSGFRFCLFSTYCQTIFYDISYSIGFSSSTSDQTSKAGTLADHCKLNKDHEACLRVPHGNSVDIEWHRVTRIYSQEKHTIHQPIRIPITRDR